MQSPIVGNFNIYQCLISLHARLNAALLTRYFKFVFKLECYWRALQHFFLQCLYFCYFFPHDLLFFWQ